MKISSCLIGEDSLLIKCGELLINKGHHIALVVSPIKKIQIWAKKHNIFLLEDFDDMLNQNVNFKFDYIFSIVNSYFLPENILSLARYAAINYHNSPLPKYAGLNSTSWAIIKKEERYGITWHLMNDKFDQGDIVKQKYFAINDNDTAFTLNLRCFEYAIETFQDLLIDIENDNLLPRKQKLSKQTYFAPYHQLPNFGFIDWKTFSAEEIMTIYRSLIFGHYDNNLGSLKIYFPQCYFIVAKIEKSETNVANTFNSGTVVSIDDGALYVSTITHVVKITELISPTSIKLTIDEVVKYFNIKVGYQLKHINNDALSILQSSYANVLHHEAFWVKQLSKVTEHSIFSIKSARHALINDPKNYIVNLKSIYPNIKIKSIQNILISAILIYLYRINNHEEISVFFVHQNFLEFYNKCANIFSYYLPFTFSIPLNYSLVQTLAQVEESTNNLFNNDTYFTDVLERYPLFEGKVIEPHVVINLSNQFNASLLSQNTVLYFELDENEGVIQIRHRFELSQQGGIKEIINNLSQHITNILINLLNNPHLSTTSFSFITEHERYNVLKKFGFGEKKPLFALQSITRLFEKQVIRAPQNTAIIINGRTLSYYELWVASEKIFYCIKEKHIPEKSMIGIYIERCEGLMAVILGILKANCVYVPLDTKYPMSRIEYMLNDAGIIHLFTQNKFLVNLSNSLNKDQHKINLHCIDQISTYANIDLQKNIMKNDFTEKLAYVIYTSGSSGTPKGVMVTHENVINYCHWFLETTRFTSDNIIDFSSSIAFDLSVPCSIAPLIAGGAIAICEDVEKTNPKQYLMHLKKNRVSHVEMTPGYLHLLLSYPKEIQQLTDLQWLLLGADTLVRSDVMKWLSLCPNHRLVNEYGPTETTVAATSYIVNSDKLKVEPSIPIGRPAYNTQCYILDKYKNICPAGMIGELYIGGAQVSKGYINNEYITKDNFIISHFNKPNDVLYKTGDVVCWLPDGNLQFLGRNDHQLKIHGYRVETAEIEAMLDNIPGINQAIVILQKGKFKNKYLRAYLQCDKQFINDEEIKTILGAQLPSFMMPKEFYIVDFIPLKENEKIDYHALKNKNYRLLPSNTSPHLRDSFNFQNTILKIWQNVFNNSSITIHDNFFDIGGDSLLALKITDDMQCHFIVDIQLRYLFEYPTVSLLSDKICNLYKANYKFVTNNAIIHDSTIIELSKGTYETPIFLIHPVGGTIFWYKQLASYLQGKYTIYGIQDPNVDGHKVTFATLEAMATYYINKINTIYSGRTYCLGGASFGATVAYEMANQLIGSGKKIEFLGLFDGWVSYPKDILKDNPLTVLKTDFISDKKISKERKKSLLGLEQHRNELLINYHLPFLNVNATIFKAKEIWEIFEKIDDDYNGWGLYIRGNIKVYKVPGNHETMFFYPQVKSLAKLIDKHFKSLRRIRAASEGVMI